MLRIEYVRIDKIKPGEAIAMISKHLNPEYLAELADSIAERGVLQPLIVEKRGEGFELIHGERRYIAARKAGLEEIPCVIQKTKMEPHMDDSKCSICGGQLKPQRIGINSLNRCASCGILTTL